MVRNQREGFSRREGISCARILERLMQTRKTLESQQPPMQSEQISGILNFNRFLSKEDEEISKSTISTVRAKEEEFEMKKMEVKEKL